MSKNVDHAVLYKHFNVPPSRANLKIVGPLETTQSVNSKFFQMGLTAADLNPIDWRKKVRLSPIMNQQNCGDCWAMATTSVLADRFIIQNNIRNLVLDPAITAQCAETINMGCQGGTTFYAGKYFETNGVPAVDDACQPWGKICKSLEDCTLPSCEELKYQCENATRYFAVKDSTKTLAVANENDIVDVNSTIANIKRELLNGPVAVGFFVPYDFIASGSGYKWSSTNGIYINGAYNDDLHKLVNPEVKKQMHITDPRQWADIQMEKGQPSGHAVSIVGWDRGKAGSYGDVSYWIVRNSWGPNWNEGGYFRIAMNDSGLNAYLGFDIPVKNVIISSTQEVIPLGLRPGEFFGGAVTFQPDLTTGSPKGSNYPGPSTHKVNVWVILVIVFAVLIAGVLGYYFFFRKGKGGRGKGRARK